MTRDTSRRRLLSRVSIQSKLLLMLLLTSVLSAAVVGAIGYQSGRNSLRTGVFDRLTEIREAQTRMIETQFADLTDSMVVYTKGSTAAAAMDAFSRGFADLKDTTITPQQQQQIVDYYNKQFAPRVQREADLQLEVAGLLPQSNPQKYLQALYTAPFTADHYSIDVDDARDKSSWTAAHIQFNDYFREIVRRFDFDDALLIDPAGNVVYSAYKGVDLGTNILTGPYRDSDLRNTFEEVLGSNAVDHVAVTDFSKYLPAYDEPTAWMMAPIGTAGHTSGVLALQFPITKINKGMTFDKRWRDVGMGATGEIFLAGPDDLMRSDSRMFLEDPEQFKRAVVDAGTPPDVAEQSIRVAGNTLVQPVASEAVRNAQRGQSGTMIDQDYLGQEVLAAYAPVNLPGLHWTMVAKIDTDEAFAPIAAFTKKLVLSTVLIIFLVCLASMFLARLFVRPVHRLEAGAQRISAGDYDTTLPVLTRDEFGDVTRSFNEMSRNLRVKDELLAEQRRENERLLLSLMPQTVAERYRQGEELVAQDHQDVSVIFADIIGLDELSTQLPSADLLGVVNRVIGQFDSAAEALGVERVRTMRSGYLASCGLNMPRLDNVRRTVDFAVEMDEIVQRFSAETGHRLSLRAGIDTGTVTSGLVGRTNVIYDMWGSAVNLAYQAQRGPREAGIYVTSAVRDAMRDDERFDRAGEITVGSAPDAHTEQIWRLLEGD
jgi:class 3 adenylate cyclase